MQSKYFLSIAFASAVMLTSCDKEEAPAAAQATPEELLTKSEWKVDELRFNHANAAGTSGAAYYYKRGVTGNISNLDNEKVLFATNNTGTYTLGTTNSPLTWQFTNPEKTKMQFTITYSPTNSLMVTWENVTLTTTTLKYGEYYTTNTGIISVGSGTRVH